MPGFVAEVTNYDELLCSQPRVIDMVPVAASQTIKRTENEGLLGQIWLW